MNGNDIIHAMSSINDKYISEFADTAKWKKTQKFWLSPGFYGSIAAAAAVGIGVFAAVSAASHFRISTIDNTTTASENRTSVPPANRNDTLNGLANTEKNLSDDSEADTEEYHYDAVSQLFRIKVYAAENSDNAAELLPNEPVRIKGDFNPLFSSSRGLGIEFEITCPSGGLTLQTDNGYFISWDRNSGAVTNYGKTYSASGLTDIFWTLSGSSPEWDEITLINVLDSNETILSVIEINGDEDTHTFSARLKNT